MFALGLTDKVSGGQWVWESDGSPVRWASWIRWADGVREPNEGTSANCVLMARTSFTSNGGHRSDGWLDYSCQSTVNYKDLPTSLVCQRNPGEFVDCALGNVSFFDIVECHYEYWLL